MRLCRDTFGKQEPGIEDDLFLRKWVVVRSRRPGANGRNQPRVRRLRLSVDQRAGSWFRSCQLFGVKRREIEEEGPRRSRSLDNKNRPRGSGVCELTKMFAEELGQV